MEKFESLGPTLLRISLGVIFLAHSVYLKAVVFTLPGTAAFFESLGLPGLSAYAVFMIEAVGGLALILGVAVRPASLALSIVSLGAAWAHSANGWLFTNEGGGWEYPLFLVAACLVQALLGAGAYRLPYGLTPKNPAWA
jgi:putative oxidoreductase